MNPLKYALAAIPDTGLTIDVAVEEADLRPAGVGGIDVGVVSVSGRIQEANGKYLFRGTVAGAYRRMCDRCLAPVERPFTATVAWAFEEGVPGNPWTDYDREGMYDPESGGVYSSVAYYAGDELDLGPLAWEEVVLAIPAKCVCREECAGLCPQCGKNLNEGPCGCAAEGDTVHQGNGGFAGLAELFPEMKPERNKEE